MKFSLREAVEHRSGGRYVVVGLPAVFRIEQGAVPAYAYRSQNTIWIRPQSEMEDGRFVPAHQWRSSDLVDAQQLADKLLTQHSNWTKGNMLDNIRRLIGEAYLIGLQSGPQA